MSTNSTVTPDPYTLQYLSFMSRRAESGLVDFNRYPQQNGNFNVLDQWRQKLEDNSI